MTRISYHSKQTQLKNLCRIDHRVNDRLWKMCHQETWECISGTFQFTKLLRNRNSKEMCTKLSGKGTWNDSYKIIWSYFLDQHKNLGLTGLPLQSRVHFGNVLRDTPFWRNLYHIYNSKLLIISLSNFESLYSWLVAL